MSRCVGEAVRDHSAGAPALSQKKVIALGLAPWGLVHNRQQLVNPQVLISVCVQKSLRLTETRRPDFICADSCVVCSKGSFPARYYVQNTTRDSCCLDNNCQAFLLVDDGSVGRRGGETAFRANLEDYISHQPTGIWGEMLFALLIISKMYYLLFLKQASMQKSRACKEVKVIISAQTVCNNNLVQKQDPHFLTMNVFKV